MTALPVHIVSTGAVCPVGIGGEQISASVRAGISKFAESSIHDRWFEPMKLALLPEDALPELAAPVDERPLTAWQRRMLRLATPALQTALTGLPPGTKPVPLFLGLPSPHRNGPPPPNPDFLAALHAQTSGSFDLQQSQPYPNGRAATMLALTAAMQYLAAGKTSHVIVGGVDTHLDLRRLAELDAENRLLGPRVMDGFIPGEGAGFLLLAAKPPAECTVVIAAAAAAEDPGHRYADAPAKGEGLSLALERMLTDLSSPPAVATTFAGLNGESFGAKEWGVATVRYAELLGALTAFEHPGDCFGDAGAAMGALLLVLANRMLLDGHKAAPALVWSSSDDAPVGCAYLTLQQP